MRMGGQVYGDRECCCVGVGLPAPCFRMLGKVPNSLYGQHMARVKLLRRMQSSVCAEQEEASVALMQSAGRRIA